MPELYSMTGQGMASDQAQTLLGDLETWGRTGERYGQKLWPLLVYTCFLFRSRSSNRVYSLSK